MDFRLHAKADWPEYELQFDGFNPEDASLFGTASGHGYGLSVVTNDRFHWILPFYLLGVDVDGRSRLRTFR